MRKKPVFALIYDFDGTIAPGNMQERDFIPAIKMNTKKFWKEVSNTSKEHQADNILVYMKLMLDKAAIAEVQVREENFRIYGRNMNYFEGVLPYKNNSEEVVKGWFDRINEYGKRSGVQVEHYIVSSGIKEMIDGTTIARKFKKVYASSFFYDHHGIAVWPSLAINYTTKTQYIFRINKGCLDVSENKKINEYTPEEERSIPFKHMVYIGDGDTDIPCFRLVRDRGGHSIAVYKPNTKGAKLRSEHLIKNGRVDYVLPADYKVNMALDRTIKAIIDKVAHDEYLNSLKQI
ncbi:MAG: haloacid dehalogenase-like hydrolase [Bacteroidales bacterium]|jgi:hypothetical protein|nr:haloacid dehalogenase-like hydrolase [Bacteroidales bacterium]OQB60050.1 MAG: haloacid dehalogenase-like hydrolase [Bacteroidetes bacterium ADurb.Bin145]HQK68281.1 HAD family hydrolase [Bacteroidales bacterium]